MKGSSVAEADDPRLALSVGGRTIGANLDLAIARGSVRRDADGRLRLAQGGRSAARDDHELEEVAAVEAGASYLYRRGAVRLPCTFLNPFLFRQAYAQGAVPFGCRDCFKVKIDTKTLRALVAAQSLAETTVLASKSGAQVDNPNNDSVYTTYIYAKGVDQAREAYKTLRPQVDAHEHLGPSVSMVIKRGCTNYERKCGPSDRYTFDPGLEAAESYLAGRFVTEKPARRQSREALDAMRMLRLAQIAYRIGDPTYKDFTGGKPLYAPTVNYAPAANTDSGTAG